MSVGEIWHRWDVRWYSAISHFGYTTDGPVIDRQDPIGRPAFSPLLPLLMRALTTTLGLSTTDAALVIGGVASAIALVLLYGWILARTGDRTAAGFGCFALALSPYAVFLHVGYTEALTLALSLGAWRLADGKRWGWAATLCALTGLAHAHGYLLAPALLVRYLSEADGKLAVRIVSTWRRWIWLVIPLVVIACHSIYLRVVTHVWDSMSVAEERLWNRTLALPWLGFQNSLIDLDYYLHRPVYLLSGIYTVIELLMVPAGVALGWLLMRRRMPGEATYVLACIAVVAFGSRWGSLIRISLTWFPLWLVVGQQLAGTPRTARALLACSAVVMLVEATLFGSGRWVA